FRNNLRFDQLTGEQSYRQPDQDVCNLAASAQEAIEAALIRVVRKYSRQENLQNVCLAGGVALNCKAIGRLGREVKNIERVYVPPFVADMGGAIGCALEVLNSLSEYGGSFQLEHAFWGYGFEDDEIARFFKHVGLTSQTVEDPTEVAAELIGKGKVIAWYQG